MIHRKCDNANIQITIANRTISKKGSPRKRPRVYFRVQNHRIVNFEAESPKYLYSNRSGRRSKRKDFRLRFEFTAIGERNGRALTSLEDCATQIVFLSGPETDGSINFP